MHALNAIIWEKHQGRGCTGSVACSSLPAISGDRQACR